MRPNMRLQAASRRSRLGLLPLLLVLLLLVLRTGSAFRCVVGFATGLRGVDVFFKAMACPLPDYSSTKGKYIDGGARGKRVARYVALGRLDAP